MKGTRIDKLIVDAGLAESRTKAQALVMAGVVLVDDRRVDKPSQTFDPASVVRLKGDAQSQRYVGRGGLKLEAALRHFEIDASGLNCIDIGSSTGGFTDCLLKHGAAHVTAIDVGTNQLDWLLRTDSRVDVREKTNARALSPSDFTTSFDLAVMDVSFISVTKIIPALIPLLLEHGRMVVLIKPQFEVARGEVGKGGIVREPEKHERVVRSINAFSTEAGMTVCGVIDSPLLGADGNKEFLAYYEK